VVWVITVYARPRLTVNLRLLSYHLKGLVLVAVLVPCEGIFVSIVAQPDDFQNTIGSGLLSVLTKHYTRVR
jgi:hypothetical protein